VNFKKTISFKITPRCGKHNHEKARGNSAGAGDAVLEVKMLLLVWRPPRSLVEET